MRDRQCALNHDAIESAPIVSSVINKPMTLSCVYHRWNFAEIFGIRKRVPGVSCGVVCAMLCFAVLVEHRLVTDRQTQAHG